MNTIALAALAATVPVAATAATFHYVDLEGEVVTIEARNAMEALVEARVNGADPNSGVKMDMGVLEEGETYAIEFEYVSDEGNVETVTAASADAALMLATDIAPTSGVMAVEAVVEADVEADASLKVD